MKKIECNDGLELEIGGLDGQGKRLVNMVNQLAECCEKCCDSQVSSELLNDIQKSIYDRFEIEEAYMQRTHAPDLSAHRKQHRLFKKKMAYCWLEIMEKHRQISVEFCDYLMEWLDFHTRNLDSRLKSHS